MNGRRSILKSVNVTMVDDNLQLTERQKLWDEAFKSDFSVKKYNRNTYISYLGMYLKLSRGCCFMMNRETGKWDEVDGLTLQPIKPKCEKKLIDRTEGFERYGT